MRIFIVISENTLYKPDFLDGILQKNRNDVVGVAISSFKPKKSSYYKHLKRHLLLLGFHGVLYIFQHKVKVFFLKMVRKYITIQKNISCAEVVKGYNIPLHFTNNVNSEAFHKIIEETEVDLIISSGNQIFGKRLLELPRIGCINRHSSLLPKYKGIYPIFWAMLHGEEKIGVSVHWMERELDRGDVIKQVEIPVECSDSFFSLFEKVFRVSVALVNDCIELIKNGKRSDREYNNGAGSYFSYPGIEDIREFKRKKLKIA